jgi:hypothetical protein
MSEGGPMPDVVDDRRTYDEWVANDRQAAAGKPPAMTPPSLTRAEFEAEKARHDAYAARHEAVEAEYRRVVVLADGRWKDRAASASKGLGQARAAAEKFVDAAEQAYDGELAAAQAELEAAIADAEGWRNGELVKALDERDRPTPLVQGLPV